MKILKLVGLTIVLCVINGSAQAQTQRSGSDTARVMQQLQQLTAEKSKLQQDNDALKKEFDDLKAKYSQMSGEQAKAQQRARELELASSKLKVSTDSNDEALSKARTQLQELITKFRETAQTLKDVETERDGLRVAQDTKQRELSACVDKNSQLYLLSNEVLGRLEQQGVWSALKNKEPFTKLTRARLENMADEYRARIDELKLGGKNASASSP